MGGAQQRRVQVTVAVAFDVCVLRAFDLQIGRRGGQTADATTSDEYECY